MNHELALSVADKLREYEYRQGYYPAWRMFVDNENVGDSTLDWMCDNIAPFNFANEDLGDYFQRKSIVEEMAALLRSLSYKNRLRAVRNV